MTAHEAEPPTLEQLVTYLRRDLRWMEGVADALDNPRIIAGINSLKSNLKRLLEKVEEVEEP